MESARKVLGILGYHPERIGDAERGRTAPDDAELAKRWRDSKNQPAALEEAGRAFFETRQARIEAKRALDAIDPLYEDPDEEEKAYDAAVAADEAALAKYVHEAAAHLKEMSAGDAAPTVSSWKSWAVDVLANIESGLVGFTAPSLVQAGTQYALRAMAPQLQDQFWGDVAFCLSVVAFNAAAEEVSNAQKREGKYGVGSFSTTAHGTMSSLQVGFGNHFNGGTVTKLVTGQLVRAVQLGIYTVTNAALNATPLASSPLYVPLKAAVSTGVSGLLVASAMHSVGKITEMRYGVKEARYMPDVAHTRTLKNGVYFAKVPPIADTRSSITAPNRVFTSTLGTAVSAFGLFAIRYGLQTSTEHGDVSKSPFANDAAIIGAGTGGLFLGQALAQFLLSRYLDDPARHPNRHGIRSTERLGELLIMSRLVHYESFMDQASLPFTKGEGGDKQEVFDAFQTVLSARPYQQDADDASKRSIATVVTEVDSLRKALDVLIASSDRSDYATAPYVDMLDDIKDSLDKLTVALEPAEKGSQEEKMANAKAKDIGNMVRDIRAAINQAQQRVGPAFKGDAEISAYIERLIPLFASVHRTDRQRFADNFLDNVKLFERDKNLKKEKTAEGHHVRDEFYVCRLLDDDRVLASDIVSKVLAFDKDVTKQTIVQDLSRLMRAKASILKGGVGISKTAEAKLAIALNMLDANGRRREVPAEGQAAAVAALAGLIDGTLKRDRFLTSFKSGEFTVQHLQEALTERQADRNEWKAINAKLGTTFISTIGFEITGLIGGDEDVNASALLDRLATDAANMPSAHRGLVNAGMTLPPKRELARFTKWLMNDIHFHPTSYSGNINALEILERYMEETGVNRTNLAGIPSQVRNLTALIRYYANSPDKIDYRSHDTDLGNQIKAIKEDPNVERRETRDGKFDLFITGIDITNPSKIGDELDRILREYPNDTFKGVGEVTFRKEIITDKNPQVPDIEGAAFQTLFEECAKRGLPVIVHCDRGTPGNKNRYAETIKTSLKAAAINNRKYGDGASKLKVIWAHGAGISRFTSESGQHEKLLDDLLQDEDLKGVLSVDLSWDFIDLDILDNVLDQLRGEKLCPDVQTALTDVTRIYRSFAQACGNANAAADLGDLNLAAEHRQAAKSISKDLDQALESFQNQFKAALADRKTWDSFKGLMDNPGRPGLPNWFRLIVQHQNRFIMGSDSLSPTTNYTGDLQYKQTQNLKNPLLTMFGTFADAGRDAHRQDVTEYEDVPRKISRENYVEFVDDPDMKAIRDRKYGTRDAFSGGGPHQTSTSAQDGLRRRKGKERETAGGMSATTTGFESMWQPPGPRQEHEEKSKLVAEKEKLQRQIADGKKELERLRSEIKQKTETVSALTRDKTRLDAEAGKVRTEVKDLEAIKKAVGDDIKETQEKLEENQKALRGVAERRGTLSDEIKGLNRERSNAAKEKELIEGELKSLKEDAAGVEKDKSENENKLRDLQRRIDEQTSKIREFDAQLDRLNEELNSKNDELADANTLIALNDEIIELQNGYIEEFEVAVRRLDAAIDRLEMAFDPARDAA